MDVRLSAAARTSVLWGYSAMKPTFAYRAALPTCRPTGPKPGCRAGAERRRLRPAPHIQHHRERHQRQEHHQDAGDDRCPRLDQVADHADDEAAHRERDQGSSVVAEEPLQIEDAALVVEEGEDG